MCVCAPQPDPAHRSPRRIVNFREKLYGFCIISSTLSLPNEFMENYIKIIQWEKCLSEHREATHSTRGQRPRLRVRAPFFLSACLNFKIQLKSSRNRSSAHKLLRGDDDDDEDIIAQQRAHEMRGKKFSARIRFYSLCENKALRVSFWQSFVRRRRFNINFALNSAFYEP